MMSPRLYDLRRACVDTLTPVMRAAREARPARWVHGPIARVGVGVLIAALALPAAAAPLQPEAIPTRVYLDRAGLPELIVQNTFFGAFAGQSITRSAFDDLDETRAFWSAALGAGAGIAAPLLVLRGRPIHAGQAVFYNSLQIWGLSNGVLATLASGRTANPDLMLGGVIGGVAGLGAGLALYPLAHLTPAQGALVHSGTLFGLASAAFGLRLADRLDERSRAAAITGLVASNVGAVAALLARDAFADVDRGRVTALDIGGILGVVAGFGMSKVVTGNKRDARVEAGFELAGMFGGAVVGFLLSEGFDAFNQAAPADPADPAGPAHAGLNLEILRPTAFAVDAAAGPQTGLGVDLLRGAW